MPAGCPCICSGCSSVHCVQMSAHFLHRLGGRKKLELCAEQCGTVCSLPAVASQDVLGSVTGSVNHKGWERLVRPSPTCTLPPVLPPAES